jgi:hypothetical protein
MKVLSRCLLLTVFAVVIIFSSISFAEEPGKVKVENGTIISAQEVKDKAGWAIGTWKGFMGGQGDWTLEIKEISNTSITGGKESIDLKGSFRYRKDNPSNAAIQLADGKMTFKAWGKEDYILSRVTETRIEGIQRRSDGKEYQIRFWKLGKEGFGTDTAKNSPFFGVWEGFWNPGSKGRYTIEYADNAVATLLYEWDDSDGWEWQNVSVSPSAEFKIGPDERYRLYRFSKDKRYLEGQLVVSGTKTSSISAGKLIEESEKLMKPRPSSSSTQGIAKSQLSSPELRWAIGKWKGFQHLSKSVRVLEIVEKDGKLNGSFMLATEKSKMAPIPVNISGDTLIFQNASREDFVLKRVSDNRMDGKYTNIIGRDKIVRFWKEGQEAPNSRLGSFEGKWASGWETTLDILYIDENAMTIFFTTKDRPDKGRGITYYANCESPFKGKYSFINPDGKYKTTIQFTQGDQKLLIEAVDGSGWAGDQATFTKK